MGLVVDDHILSVCHEVLEQQFWNMDLVQKIVASSHSKHRVTAGASPEHCFHALPE
jgi:hypothetical protein